MLMLNKTKILRGTMTQVGLHNGSSLILVS